MALIEEDTAPAASDPAAGDGESLLARRPSLLFPAPHAWAVFGIGGSV
jgi:hypothetical protein